MSKRSEVDEILAELPAADGGSGAGKRSASASQSTGYLRKRRKLSGVFFETALPNEYLVQVGRGTVKPVLGGRRFRLFRKFLRIPGSVETLYFSTDNANVNYQGIGVQGYASWRIDPDHPEVAVATLDFFDEDDPMRDTNHKLTTICVEAVRHVIANMSIDDALKKKDEIGNNLKDQLKKFEEKWGIVFDQVGIEKVSIMTEKLFEQQRVIKEDRFRKDAEFRMEQQNTEYETQMKEQQLKVDLQKLESAVLKTELDIENVRSQIDERKLDVLKLRRAIGQEFTSEQLSHEFIDALPEIYKALKIDNYSIMNTGADGGISPIGNVLQEVIGLVRANGLEGLLTRPGTGQVPGSDDQSDA